MAFNIHDQFIVILVQLPYFNNSAIWSNVTIRILVILSYLLSIFPVQVNFCFHLRSFSVVVYYVSDDRMLSINGREELSEAFTFSR